MFDEAGVTWSVFRDFATALAEDPDLSLAEPDVQPGRAARDRRLPGAGNADEFHRRGPRGAGARAALGEHTEEILGDVAGLPDAEIAALFDEGSWRRRCDPGRRADGLVRGEARLRAAFGSRSAAPSGALPPRVPLPRSFSPG
jgi:hypothetical protein